MLKSLLLLSFCLSHLTAKSQDTVSYTGVDFIQHELNRIQNTVVLSKFYDKLYQLKKTKTGTVNILQIGDSHIQADYLSGTTRMHLQKEFGNAGRGLVFPGRVGRTNEPPTLYSTSKAHWEAKRIIYTNQPTPIGLGAMTLTTKEPEANLLIRIHSVDGLSYSFNKLKLLYQKDFSSFNILIKDSVGTDLAYAGPYTVEEKNVSSIVFPEKQNQIELVTRKSTASQNQFSLYGMILENGEPGIQYHATGGNGAKVKHYLEATLFAEQSNLIHPDVIIISLGTNEAIEHPYVDPKFTDQLHQLVNRLGIANPDAMILLTTPLDFYKKKTRRNPGVEMIRNSIVAYAETHNLAYWDLFTIGGGKQAADSWNKNNLLQKDGIHFTKAGYYLQGKLLYEALMKGYTEYVQYRYP